MNARCHIVAIALSLFSMAFGLEKIPALIGQDVHMTCVCPITTVGTKWLGPNGHVAGFYRDGQSDPEAQHPSYEGRADCGNGTLHLKNVSSSDFGLYQYQCFKEGGEDGPPINISLYDRGTTAGDITPGNATDNPTVLLLCLCLCLLAQFVIFG